MVSGLWPRTVWITIDAGRSDSSSEMSTKWNLWVEMRSRASPPLIAWRNW
jgi:hypothetical protein